MELRPYQKECINIIENLDPGSYLVQMATGLGKTKTFTHIPRHGRVLILSHREELVEQPRKDYDCSFGIERAQHHSNGEEVVSASVQTMTRRLDRFDPDEFDMIITDECFPAGTFVDGRPIESLKIGDYVNAYNHITGNIEEKRIIHCFKNPAPEKLVIINGNLVCTENHPIYMLEKGDYQYAKTFTSGDHILHYVRSGDEMGGTHEIKERGLSPSRTSVLLRSVLKRIFQKNIIRDNGKDEQKNCDRSGRRKSLRIGEKSGRREENGFLAVSRVDSIEVLEQGSAERFKQLCPDGYVYNIEVEDDNNYFANGCLVHNCHHASATSYRRIYEYFNPRLHLGFTATPNRGDKVRLDDIFQDIIFQRDLRWGVENNWLSDVFCRRVNIGYDLRDVHTSRGDYAPGELEEAMDGTADAIAEVYRTMARGATLIFAVSVAQAEEIAGKIPGAVAVTGETKERSKIIDAFTAGQIPCIVNVMVFTEGTDIPRIETLIIARPTQNDSLYTQMVGRGLRLYPGKERLNLIDCVGVSGRASLCTAPSLLGIDLEDVPESKQSEIEGDLFDLPMKAVAAADCPESWIRNIQIIDLWAKEQRYQTHDVNWFKLPSGDLVCSLPDKHKIMIPVPDQMGMTTFDGKRMSMQGAFDRAFTKLRDEYKDAKPLWDLNAVKRWGQKQATDKQVAIIQRRCKGFDTSGLNSMQASMILNRLFSQERRRAG